MKNIGQPTYINQKDDVFTGDTYGKKKKEKEI
jgi:hypothetical protein